MKKNRLTALCLFLFCLYCIHARTTLSVILYDRNYDLDPHTASYNSESQLLTGIYEGLYSYDNKTMEAKLALAQSVDVSKDKKTYTFKIREDATFSDGKKITAGEVRDSWLSLLSTKNAPFSSLLDCVEGAQGYRMGKTARDDVKITAKDETSLQVVLKKPTQYFPKILCHHALSVKSSKKDVYSGAFVLKENKDKKIIFEKNQNYWDKKNVVLENITFLLQEDAKENTHTFNNGDVDWVQGNFDGSLLLNNDSLKVSAQFGTTYYFFKIREGSIWSKKDFRNALIAATPWDKLREGQFIPASTLVFSLDDYPAIEGLNTTDTFRAKQMLEVAKKDANMKSTDIVSVTLALSAGEGAYTKKQADILVKAWQDIGVKVNIQKTPEDRYLESIANWDADVFSYSWVGDYLDPIAFLELFRGNSSLNVANYCNEEYDELLEKADAQKKQDRNKTLSQAEEILLGDGIIFPISHSVNVNLIDTDIVGGWYMNALDIHPLKDLYIKSKTLDLPNLVFGKPCLQ